MRQDAALERALAAPGHVGDEVLEPERRQPLADAGVVVGVVAGQDEQLLHPAARRVVQQALDLSRARGGARRCVANAQYLQCETHVRDSDSVRLREKVTRRVATPDAAGYRAPQPLKANAK